MRALSSAFRHALRAFHKDPGSAALAVVLLALGIGANTAIFSIAYSVLLRPLPYADPDRLVVALHGGDSPVSPADYLDYRAHVQAFQHMAAAQVWGASLLAGDRPQQIPGMQISANMLPALGVSPLLGRSFLPAEEHAAGSKVLLLSYGLWQNRFGGDRHIVGRRVLLDRVPYTVVGVMPSGFRFAPFWATRAQMWSPLVLDARLDDRGGRSLRVFARLRPGITLAQAQSEMDAMARHLAQSYPATNAKLGISVVPLQEKVVQSVRPTLLVLLATVGFVLLIACATVGNLLLSRALARRREMALRLAIGARRFDLVRIVFGEVLLLAVCGGAGGILLGSWAVGLLSGALPPDSVPRQAELGFSGTAILFAVAATLLSALLAGIIPAMQALRADLNSDLKDGGRGSSQGSGRSGLRSILIAAEVALSLILLVGAGLMVRTMRALQSVDAGFNPRRVLTLQVALSGTPYDRNGHRVNLFRELAGRLSSVPSVESVSAINHLPIGGDLWNIDYTIQGRPKPAAGDQTGAVYRVIQPNYFRTMQLGLLAGRDFDLHDNLQTAPVAIINETMAKARWPGQSPLGKVIFYGITPEDLAVGRTIVGVAKDARQNDWTSPARDEIYLPYYQRPDSMGLSYLTFVLRTHTDPDTLAAAVVQQINAFERGLSVSEVASMERIISDELWRERLATVLMASFAALALLLAAVGIYGVVSHAMRQRTQEIGIRIALGAQSADLVALALGQGMRPVLVGALLGLVCALLLSRFLRALLFGVTPGDPFTFVAIAGLLLAVCLFANLLPALRAARVDPLTALRHD